MSTVRDNLFLIATSSKNCIMFEATCKRDIYNLFIIRKMIRRYINKRSINERLLLNNLIISINVFELDVVLKLFGLILSEDEMKILYTLLNYIGVCRVNDICIELNKLLHDSMSHRRDILWD